jgi:transcriptional regulator with XRE-family HTH domain
MLFYEQLAALRRAKGISQETLAEQLGVSRQAVSKWETGTAKPELDNILALCRILEVSPNELLGDTTQPINELAPSVTVESLKAANVTASADRKKLLKGTVIWLACIILLIILGISLRNSIDRGEAPKIESCRIYESRALDNAREFTLQITYEVLPEGQPNEIILLLSPHVQDIYKHEQPVTVKDKVGYVTFILPYGAECTVQHQSKAKGMHYQQDILKITSCTKEDYSQEFLIE